MLIDYMGGDRFLRSITGLDPLPNLPKRPYESQRSSPPTAFEEKLLRAIAGLDPLPPPLKQTKSQELTPIDSEIFQGLFGL